MEGVNFDDDSRKTSIAEDESIYSYYENERTSDLCKQYQRKSYSSDIDLINAFLQDKGNERNGFINKKRKLFGIYLDCSGVSKKQIYFNENEKGMISVRFSPDGLYSVAGFGSGSLKLYDVKELMLKETIIHGKETGFGVTCIRFQPNSSRTFYASSAEGFIVKYDIEMEDLSYLIEDRNNEINAIDISCDSSDLVTGCSDNSIKLYNLETSHLLCAYSNDNRGSDDNISLFHTNRVHAVRYMPDDSHVFLSGGWDRMLKMWDTRTKYGCVKTEIGPHISGDAIDILGNQLLTGSWEAKNSINVRDLRTLTLIQNVVPLNAPKLLEGVHTYAVQFFNGDATGDLVLQASLGYKSTDVISISQNIMLQSYVSDQSCVCVDSHGPNIVFGGMHSVLNFVVFYMNILVNFEDRPRNSMESAKSSDVASNENLLMDDIS